MRILLAIAVFILPTALFAQAEEDAEHRADRLRTEQLNRDAGASVGRRNSANAAALERYRNAQEDYQRARAEWRRRVAACEDGDWRACDRPY